MTVNSGAGRVHASQWAQSYNLNLDGPLFNPDFGAMREAFSYGKGASISQAATTSIPQQQLTSLMMSADLFSIATRRFVHLSPNFSRSYLHQEGQANGGLYSNTVANNAWGVSTGLSLPRLPALNYARQVNDLRNPSDITPVKERSTIETKSASYFLGHVVVNASEHTDRVEDRLGLNAPQKNDYKQASLEANYYEPRRLKALESLFFRGDASQIASNDVTSQKVASASFGLFSKKFKTGSWESAVNYGNGASRDFLTKTTIYSQNASVNSTHPLRTGTLGSSLTLLHAPSAASLSVGEGLSLNQSFWRGLFNSSLGASGAWSRAASATTLSDSLSGRWDLYPSRPTGFFAEARTSGADRKSVV